MAHEYEYATVIRYIVPLKLGGSPSYRDEPAQVALLQEFNKVANNLPKGIDTALGDGWEVNSHSLTFQDEVAILSILLKRHRI